MKSVFLLFVISLTSSNARIFKRQTDTCICVPYYQCENGKIITTGGGLLDQRPASRKIITVSRVNTCTGVEVCCEPPGEDDPEEPAVTTSTTTESLPIIPSPDPRPAEDPTYTIPTLTGTQGCGRRRLPGRSVREMNRISDTSSLGETFYGEAPWMVQILDGNKKFVCGGSLISPNIVLTAAHCVSSVTREDIVLRLGDYNTRITSEPVPHEDRKASQIILHPKFNSNNLNNDIALVGLDSPVKLGETIDILCTPDQENPTDNSQCHAYGWGKVDFTSVSPLQDTLRKVRLPLISKEECQNKLRLTRLGKFFKLLPGFICAGGEEDKDTCKGDGGGPLLCPLQSDPNRLIQVGIISWGIDCAKGNPAVFASVAHYMPWIKEQITNSQ